MFRPTGYVIGNSGKTAHRVAIVFTTLSYENHKYGRSRGQGLAA